MQVTKETKTLEKINRILFCVEKIMTGNIIPAGTSVSGSMVSYNYIHVPSEINSRELFHNYKHYIPIYSQRGRERADSMHRGKFLPRGLLIQD